MTQWVSSHTVSLMNLVGFEVYDGFTPEEVSTTIYLDNQSSIRVFE